MVRSLKKDLKKRVGGRKTTKKLLLNSVEGFLGWFFPFKYQTHSCVLWLDQVDLCLDYLLLVGETTALISRSCLRRLGVFYLLCRAALQVCRTLPWRPLRAGRQPVRIPAMCPRQGVCAQGSRLYLQLLAGQRWSTVNTNTHMFYVVVYLLWTSELD